MSSDSIYAIIRTPLVLAPASRLCFSLLYSPGIDINFSLLANKAGDEEADTRWVPEPNRHRSCGVVQLDTRTFDSLSSPFSR